MWAKWWKAAESAGFAVRDHPDPGWDGYLLPEPKDPVLCTFAFAAEQLGEANIRSLISGLADSGWHRQEFRDAVAGLPDGLREETIWAYRLPDAFIKARIPDLDPTSVTLFQEALKFVAFAIAARATAPEFSSAILDVWRRQLGPVPGIDERVPAAASAPPITPMAERGRSAGQAARRLRREVPTGLFVTAVVLVALVALAAFGGAFDGLIPSTSGWAAFRDWATDPQSNAMSLERRAQFARLIRSTDPQRSAMSSVLADERTYIGEQLEWLRGHRPEDCYRDAYEAIRGAFRKEHDMLRLTESAVRWSEVDEWARAQGMTAEAERMRERATSVYLAAAQACESR